MVDALASLCGRRGSFDQEDEKVHTDGVESLWSKQAQAGTQGGRVAMRDTGPVPWRIETLETVREQRMKRTLQVPETVP